MYPNCDFEREEQARYKVRLQQHANDACYDSVDEYIKDSRYRYVILSNANNPQHDLVYDLVPPPVESKKYPGFWLGEEDETCWCVYESREEAEEERQNLIEEGDYGHRVVTERYFLKMKGLI